jgi:hypothetical protein
MHYHGIIVLILCIIFSMICMKGGILGAISAPFAFLCWLAWMPVFIIGDR